jgi:diketogulonate reductase-like aldo/keto reductase
LQHNSSPSSHTLNPPLSSQTLANTLPFPDFQNEQDIGQAIKESKIPREDIFITSKISPYEQGTDMASAAVENILSRLSTSYLDLLLIHWPGVSKLDPQSDENAQLRQNTWKVVENCCSSGKAKAIGVSNYEISHLEDLLSYATIKPAVNQIEVHPCFQNRQLRQYCSEKGIQVVAYASLGAGSLLDHPAVLDVVHKENKTGQQQLTPAQVLLLWALHHQCAVIPKSISPSRIQQFDPEILGARKLSPDSTAVLDAVTQGDKVCWDPRIVK